MLNSLVCRSSDRAAIGCCFHHSKHFVAALMNTKTNAAIHGILMLSGQAVVCASLKRVRFGKYSVQTGLHVPHVHSVLFTQGICSWNSST